MPKDSRAGYRRHASRSESQDVRESDREQDRDREREERRRRRKKQQAHTSADSSAELLSSYRDSPSRSPEKARYRDESSPEKRERRGYRRDGDDEERRRTRREERRRREEEEEAQIDVVEVVEYPASSGVNSELDRYAARERMRVERRRKEQEQRDREDASEGEAVREERRRRRKEERRASAAAREANRAPRVESESSGVTPATTTRNTLSSEGLAALDALNEKMGHSAGARRVRREAEESEIQRREEYRLWKEERRRRKGKQNDEGRDREKEPDPYDEYLAKEERYRAEFLEGQQKRENKGRTASGQRLEKGGRSAYTEGGSVISTRWWWQKKESGSSDSGYISLSPEEEAQFKKRRRRTFIILGIIILILAIAIPVGIVVSKKNTNTMGITGGPTPNDQPINANLQGVDPNSVPENDKGGWLDPFSWYDTTDFNVTYTNQMVGGLPVIGLNSSFDDGARANDNVPALDQKWDYGKMPIRGINVGGWLVMEPLITPSYFSRFKTSDGVVDEWTLAAKLPPSTTKSTFEQHYSSFLTESDFQQIQAAGFDHVRIPYGYWAVTTYPGDPYVAQVSWRYLLRALEYCRKYGLRVKLDMHGAPGSQNGWNHSGKQGVIGWLNGTEGALNGQRTTDLHVRLATFFSQTRYANLVTLYGLVNEPKMTFLDVPTVLSWTTKTVAAIRSAGLTRPTIAFGDGFMGLDNWAGKLQDVAGLVLDVHQYVIFNTQQLALDHSAKTTFACRGWTAQALRSQDRATGFGPTLFAEWSQADTDCAVYLNNVGVGSRWEGTLNFATGGGGGSNASVLSPTCPTDNNPRCSCREANADPKSYSPVYARWLREFAEAQMESFEKGWGWFYWTWKTEGNVQWSYRDGLAAGILPPKTWQRDFACSSGVPDYAALGLEEFY